MHQVTVVSPPAPPAPQQPGFGDAIRDMVDGAVSGALQGTRAELQGRIASLQAEREGLAAALRNTGSRPARLEIQTRIERLDREISETRNALSRIDRQVSTRVQRGPTFAETRAPDAPNFGRINNQFDPTGLVIAVVGIIFVGFPIALTLARFLWKRATAAPVPALSPEQARRFDRLEQSVDAIAIEIERISENQRYLTKVLSEPRASASVGSGSGIGA